MVLKSTRDIEEPSRPAPVELTDELSDGLMEESSLSVFPNGFPWPMDDGE